MKFIDLIKEDEYTRQYKKAHTIYKALRKGKATVSVNVAYTERNGIELHTFEYMLPKENYIINVTNLYGSTTTHIRCEKMVIIGKKIPIMDTLIIGAVSKRFSKDFGIDLIINDVEYTEEGVRNDGLLKEEPNERELEIEKVKTKTKTVYKALKKGTLNVRYAHGQPDVKFKYELPDEYRIKVLGSTTEGFKSYIKLTCNHVKIETLDGIERDDNQKFGIGFPAIKHKFGSFDIEMDCLFGS
jgi:hypothetical protein